MARRNDEQDRELIREYVKNHVVVIASTGNACLVRIGLDTWGRYEVRVDSSEPGRPRWTTEVDTQDLEIAISEYQARA